MTFTLSGQFLGKKRAVTWQDEVLSGDSYVLDIVRILAKSLEGVPVGPSGGFSYTVRDHLRDPISAGIIIRRAFNLFGPANVRYEGDRSEPPTYEEGVVY